MSPSQPKIAIIGCGPAGLTIGRLLHKHGIRFTIFELRQKPTDEELSKPSGSLDLHTESGLAAIEECGLMDDFLQLTGDCAEWQIISDKDGNILYKDEGEISHRPEISRHALTNLLVSHIPENSIKWGHRLSSARSIAVTGQTQVELDFGPQGKQVFDLVVGADGAWSRVRNLLTEVKPHYGGRQCITLTIRQIGQKYPQLSEFVGPGSFFALGTRHGVISQRGSQDSARIYIFLTTTDEQFAATSGFEGKTAVEVKSSILADTALLGPWGDRIKELVATACDEESADNPGANLDIRPLYMLPIGHKWEYKAGVTLIGDAAHLMGPWAGEGANLAMWDSLSLAHAIVKARETAGNDDASFPNRLNPLINKFEAEMVARAKEMAEGTHRNGEMMFGEDGARAFANFFLSAMPAATT